jgi:hypothetical protein
MSKGLPGRCEGEGGVGGESEGDGEGWRVALEEAVELAAEVVDGGGDMLEGSMVRALLTSAVSYFSIATGAWDRIKRKERNEE